MVSKWNNCKRLWWNVLTTSLVNQGYDYKNFDGEPSIGLTDGTTIAQNLQAFPGNTGFLETSLIGGDDMVDVKWCWREPTKEAYLNILQILS